MTRMLVTGGFWLAIACSSTSKSTVQQTDASTGGAGGSAGKSTGGSGNAPQGGGSGQTSGGAAGAQGSTGAGGAAGTSGTGGTGGTSGASGAGGSNGKGGTSGVAGAAGDAGVPQTCRNIPALSKSVFCDDFEASDLRQWRHYTSGGTDGVTRWVPNPARGSGSVHSIKSAAGPNDPLLADALGRIDTGRIHVRVWLYIPGGLTISTASILVIGEDATFGGVSLVAWPDGLSLQVNPGGAQPGKFQFAIPRDQWFCVRMIVPIGTSVPKSQFRLRFGSQELTNIEPDAPVNSQWTYNRIWLGVNYIAPTQTDPMVVYYDDLAVDTIDIACQ